MYIHCDLDRAMAELLLNPLDVLGRRNQDGRVAMSQIIESDSSQSGYFDRGEEHPVALVSSVKGLAGFAREDELKLAPTNESQSCQHSLAVGISTSALWSSSGYINYTWL